MQDFILSATWTATAGCVLAACFLLAMICGGTVIFFVLQGYYWMKVQQERMEQKADKEIAALKPQKQDELERIVK